MQRITSSIHAAATYVSETAHSPQSLIVGLLAILLIFILYRCIQYFISDLPPLGSGLKLLPGPISTVPYLGRIHDVDRMHAWNAMLKFSNQYNGLFSCTLGGETHIWIAREDVAQDLLCRNAAICSARADLGAYPDVTKGYKYLPLLGYTDHLVRQRKFAHTIMMRNVNSGFDGYLNLEVKRLLHELLVKPNSFYHLIHLFCARISSRLAYGSDESAQDHVVNAGKFIHQLGPSGPLTNLVPLLRFLPEWLVPDKRDVRLREETEERLWKGLFQEAKEKYKQGAQAATYVRTSLETKENDKEGKRLFEVEEEAKFAVGMMCIVAIFTIGGPAIVFVMAMVLHPEWQDRIRAQIEEVVDDDDLVDLKHSPRLPVLRAAILECVRWKSTVPLGVPRLLEKNYTYDGYHFPKHSVVHVLDIAMSQDPERYQDPKTYNPDRWLDPKSPNFKAPLMEYPRLKGHHIFGRGKRMCPGQDLAEAELFVLCGNLVKFFTFSAKGEPPNPERWGTDVIGGPLPFDCSIEIRDESKRKMVQTMYREAFPGHADI